MKWFKENSLWLAVNIIAIVLLVGILNSFNIDFTGMGTPAITVEQAAMAEPEFSTVAGQIEPEMNDRAPQERSPLTFLVKETGEWAIRWLVLSLSCTPLYILFGWRKMLTVKKILGLYAFTFTLLHLLFFLADQGWLAVFDEFNFILGLMSLLIMLPLALTSTQWSMKAMGKSWKLLHRAVYAAGILAVLHAAILGEGSALLYGLIVAVGLVARVPQIRRAVTGFRRYFFRRSPLPA